MKRVYTWKKGFWYFTNAMWEDYVKETQQAPPCPICQRNFGDVYWKEIETNIFIGNCKTCGVPIKIS